jgi:hypothetical protein
LKNVSETKNALVLRTDFSDDPAWETVSATIRRPVGGFKAYLDLLADPEYAGITPEQLVSIIPPGSNRTFIFIVDRTSLSHPDHPILVVDLNTEPGRTFRAIPSEMWSVENNLSIANMDFAEFADSVGQDGVFRGFPGG